MFNVTNWEDKEESHVDAEAVVVDGKEGVPGGNMLRDVTTMVLGGFLTTNTNIKQQFKKRFWLCQPEMS